MSEVGLWLVVSSAEVSWMAVPISLPSSWLKSSSVCSISVTSVNIGTQSLDISSALVNVLDIFLQFVLGILRTE